MDKKFAYGTKLFQIQHSTFFDTDSCYLNSDLLMCSRENVREKVFILFFSQSTTDKLPASTTTPGISMVQGQK